MADCPASHEKGSEPPESYPHSPTDAQEKSPFELMLERAFYLAEWTGLEPATPGVTGRYSNRLNYRSLVWLNRETGGC